MGYYTARAGVGRVVIRAYKCAKFQQKIFSEKKWHPSGGILSKNFQFSNLNSDFIGKFSDFQVSSKFVKNYILGPLSLRSFSKIQRETFGVENFPIFSTT